MRWLWEQRLCANKSILYESAYAISCHHFFYDDNISLHLTLDILLVDVIKWFFRFSFYTFCDHSLWPCLSFSFCLPSYIHIHTYTYMDVCMYVYMFMVGAVSMFIFLTRCASMFYSPISFVTYLMREWWAYLSA